MHKSYSMFDTFFIKIVVEIIHKGEKIWANEYIEIDIDLIWYEVLQHDEKT